MADKRPLTFVTNNKEKIADIKKMLGDKFELFFASDLELLEIQSLEVEEVVVSKAKQAYDKLGSPAAVSDSGLEIVSLKKFPGALVRYVNETIGQEGLVKLLEGESDRRAFFVASIGFCDENGPNVFAQRDEGTITFAPRGTGWHFDRIFIPKGETRTWAEIGRERKNESSAFRRALGQLAEWLEKRGKKKE